MVRKSISTVALLLALSHSAWASCLTIQEARAKWPKAHLYWHTEHRCWDNSRTWSSSRPALAAATTRNIAPLAREAPTPGAPPTPTPPPLKHWGDYCCWPQLHEIAPGLEGHITGEPK